MPLDSIAIGEDSAMVEPLPVVEIQTQAVLLLMLRSGLAEKIRLQETAFEQLGGHGGYRSGRFGENPPNLETEISWDLL